MRSKTIYFPGLNGLRALAALSVVVFHLTVDFDKFNLSPYLFGRLADGKPNGFAMAGFGVTIFFALSGFLITYLLLEEKAKGEINIKKFYIRRILRIWPLYYLYLAAAVIVIFYFGLRFNGGTLLLYIFYAANVPFIFENMALGLDTTLPFLRHYWSLGVEEQYYLFWPWVVKKLGSRLKTFVLVFIAAFIILKCIFHFFMMGSFIAASFNVVRFDCMLIGSLGAIYYHNRQPLFMKWVTSKAAQGIAWLCVATLLLNVFHIASIIDHDIVSVVTVVLIMGQVNIKNRLVNLDIKLFDFLGKISYGIYIIHPLVIFFSAMLLKNINLPAVAKYAVIYGWVAGITILLAWLSYEYIEKPFLKLKGRYTVIKSSGQRVAE